MNFSSKSGQNFDRPMYLERISRKMEECGKDDRKKNCMPKQIIVIPSR